MATIGTPEQFQREVLAWCEAARVSTRQVVVETIQDINEEIVVRSPLKTGFLRGSWFAALNTAPIGRGQIGGASIARLNAAAAALELGDTYFAANTAAYARRLEFGFVGEDSLGRHYNQAGRFWVRGVMNQASRIAMEAVARVAAGQTGGARPGGGGALPDVGIVT